LNVVVKREKSFINCIQKKQIVKKVLIITYYWPPSGKASLHWPLDIARYFPQYGWEPVVLTVEEEKFSHPDESLLKSSEWIKTFRTKTWEPFSLYKKFTGREKDSQLIASETISTTNKSLSHRISVWIRMNLFVPDARAGWYPYAVKAGKEIISQENISGVISVGPPHSAHLIGKKLSDEGNIPHYPVFIDPWTDIVYYRNFKRSTLTLKLDNYFERSVLEHARQVVFVTGSMEKDYIAKYPFLAAKTHVLYWGYNEENFNGIKKKETKSGEEVILHAGNIFDYQNVPEFWKRIKSEIEKGRDIRIKFTGTVSPAIKRALTDSGLKPYTEYLGFLPYHDVLTEMMSADFLFVCATEKRHLPGKLFEYMRSGTPIIAFGDDNAEVEELLAETGSGKLYNYSEDGTDILQKKETFLPDIEKAKKYNRQNIARKFSEILHRFT
jgi:glycosyltransferase involved in cell wall biosynthesis